ncbi:MAG: hypothetical protein CMI81_03545 [Candidatus Pelagibacter sp.]|nr:hypothetical protein [Candidatus Pelagibacter sp.]|tara:strand:- start:140 stop:907 length:768 start_codon:yes stop_codon:yes gene_type:complete
MKKILLVSGDSFSDRNFHTMIHPELDTSWSKWPELLADKLNMECVNIAKSGAGNDYIYEALVDTLQNIDKDRIGLVIAAWSQCQRRSWQESKRLSWKNSRVDTKGDVFYWTKRTMRYWYSFQVLCERYNLPYKQFQMISLFQGWLNGLFQNDHEVYRNKLNPDPNFIERHTYPGEKDKDEKLLTNMVLNYEDHINTKNFIGWPLYFPFQGFHVEYKVLRDVNHQPLDGMVISKHDAHPTAKGQKAIAEFIHDRLE